MVGSRNNFYQFETRLTLNFNFWRILEIEGVPEIFGK